MRPCISDCIRRYVDRISCSDFGAASAAASDIVCVCIVLVCSARQSYYLPVGPRLAEICAYLSRLASCVLSTDRAVNWQEISLRLKAGKDDGRWTMMDDGR
jgi:hypothetical protein